MEKVDMNYSFFSGKEPTDAQLAQLMREACSDAVERAREADVKFVCRKLMYNGQSV